MSGKKETNNMNKDIKIIIRDIYSDVFRQLKQQYIVVFLCGGGNGSYKNYLRDRVRTSIENSERYSWQLPIKVFYPEDLLIEVLNQTKEADLLSYEQILADNSHIIVIICESAGALVELGAFTNNEYTVNKVIAAVEKKHIKDKSFIMQGPVKYLKRRDKLNFITYGTDEQTFAADLIKNIREKYKKENHKRELDLSTIIGVHYFILVLLYFFKSLNSKELSEFIKYAQKEENTQLQDFNVIFSAALKLLFHDQYIIKRQTDRYSIYDLTKKGHEEIKKMISSCTRIGVCDSIRVRVMYHNLYKSPRS